MSDYGGSDGAPPCSSAPFPYVLPRYMLTSEERRQLSPLIHRVPQHEHKRDSLVLNRNYETVTSRYHEPQRVSKGDVQPAAVMPGRVARGGAAPVTPERPDNPAPPSMKKYPSISSRFMCDVRLESRHASEERRDGHHAAAAAAPSVHPPRAASPFRAGVRSATPADLSRRNARLLDHASHPPKPLAHIESVVRQYVNKPLRSATPERRGAPGSCISPRPSTPRRQSESPSRALSPSSRCRSPTPVRPSIVTQEKHVELTRVRRASAVVSPSHVPRVASLSLAHQCKLAGGPPVLHWH